MKKIIGFFEADWSIKKLPWVIFCLPIVNIAYCLLFTYFFRPADNDPSPIASFSLVEKICYVVLLGPMIEEMLFRFPLAFAALLGNFYVTATTVILSSTFFGLLHGDVWNLGVQGIGGIILSMIFLKFGGANKKPFKGLFCSFSYHSSFNGSLLLLAAIFK